ncbi:MAG: Mu-like prophage major head subunit gpT family protein [Verrucomicrobiota bacterium]
MSIVLTHGYLRGLNTGYNITLKKALDALAGSGPPRLSDLLLEETNAAGFASMEYDSAAGIPMLKELTGNLQEQQNLSTVQFTIENKTWSRLIGLNRAVLERQQGRIYERDITNHAMVWPIFKEQRLASALTGGFTFVDYTGSPFFSAARKIAAGKPGTIANLGTKKLSAANFETGVKSIRTRTDAEGNILGLGSKMVLVVSANNESLGQSIVQMAKLTSGADNPNFNKAELRVWPYLDVLMPDAWFLFDTQFVKPAIYQTEVPLASYMQTNPEDASVMLSDQYLYQLYHRGNLSLSDPTAAYGSTGADAA